jgi:CRISPR system Cascade subunit CasE
MSDDASLQMVRLALEGRGVAEVARRRALRASTTDDGYLVHCLLVELFGDLAPRPFALAGTRGRALVVLGYTSTTANELRRHADTFAAPNVHRTCQWEQLAVKAMPRVWPEGTRLGFAVRVCPVVRMSGEGPTHRKGAEVDAFLATTWKADPSRPQDRETVYREWLRAAIERRGGARLVAARLSGFRIARLLRRTQGSERRAELRERPDAHFTGEIEVTDSAAFAALLRAGIGRHRSFGFGMLLLHPVGRTAC